MLLLECPTLLWLLTSFQELESVINYNPDLAREDSRCNDNLVRQGSSLRNWGRWGRPLQRVWCQGFLIRQWYLVPLWHLPKPYWSMHFRDVSETNGHSEHACDLKRKGRPENEGLNWQLRLNGRRQWRSNYKARGRVEKGSKFMVKPIFKYTGPWIRRHEYMKLFRSGVMGFRLN